MTYEPPKCKECGKPIQFIENMDPNAKSKWLIAEADGTDRIIASWMQGPDGKNTQRGKRTTIYKAHKCEKK